ncbi:hypothetical protein Cgig2_012889 [Carnegiea gigantea]|uniref:C2 NT-type domain-containing protein n=1 Tax=Carnegiea gigantea TaxID=171969 RepID=A0A9Q1Q9L6_9CARY|nr:hypothetical protein Cgig2_012889 [Carnegiea gigantea]
MFKLNKHKSDKYRDKFDFKFSNFQAIQVPKGWDRLFVSLVSVETGKTIAKSGKASVRNGTCRWTETFSESIFISQENVDSEELEGGHFKFVVAMGSSRSGILGEVSVNLGDHASSKTANTLTLQLNKCNYSTSLQFRIQCLTPKAKYRDAQSRETNINVEHGSSDHDDMEAKSDASDGAFSRSAGSTSSNHLESASISRGAFSREPSVSASEPRHSFESTGASSGNNLLGAVNDNIERQDSIGSQNSGPSYSFNAGNDNRSDNSSFHSRALDSLGPNGHKKEPNSNAMSSPSFHGGSPKDLLEAAEVTIEELRAEARMWERNAKKLMLDVDALKKDLSDQSRNQETLNMELSASHQECNGLKQEIKHLKSLLEEFTKKQNAEEDLKLQAKDMDEAQHEMEEEIMFLRESNASLNEQLQKTQESNVELLTILQELEGIVETQKLEIQNLSSEKLKLEESAKLGPSEDADSGDSNPEGIDDIKLQLQQLQETQEELESAILELESTVEQKDSEIEMERELRMDAESKWKIKVAAQEGEIMKLEAKLSEAIKERRGGELEVETGDETDSGKEIEFLRTKVQELEHECNELTEENLQLHVKLKGPVKDLSSDDSVDSSCGSPDCTCGPKVSKLRTQLLKLKQELRDKVPNDGDKLQHSPELINSQANGTNFHALDKPETIDADTTREMANKACEVEGLTSVNFKEEAIEVLRKQLSTLENQISSLHEENRMLQESLETEKTYSAESLEEQKKKVVMLERLSSELEKGKEEVEQQLSELEKENMQLTDRISALEAQLRYLTNEKEACQLELQDSKSQVMNLRDEVKRLESDIEAQKVDMKQKMQDLQNRWLEAQEECEYLKQANPKLQITAENLIEEITSLQKYNGELKRQNNELVTRYSAMESQLRESTARFSECSEKVEALEAEFSLMAEEFSLKEKSLKSEFDSLVTADKEYKEKLMQENISLNNMYSQKVVEVEKVQRELVHLIDQISLVNNEQSSDAMLELSTLRTEKAKLEVSLQQLQRQFVRSESKLSESEAKAQELTRELKVSRQKQEALMADHDKVLKLLENIKSNEAKHKSTIAELEKNLKASGYERLQLAEEVCSLKEQLQRATSLQGEVLTLKSSLNNAKFESEKAKTTLDLLRDEHEKLKSEKDFLAQKISGMQKALSGLEECQRSKMTLEEKVLRLEGDLAAREALSVQDAELKFELNKVKRANGELQRKIKHLEQDQEDHLKKVKALEEQLKRKNQGIEDDVNSVSNPSDLDESTCTLPYGGDTKQLSGDSGAANADYLSEIQTLENELAEALEANEMYKSQLRRFLSEEEKNSGNPKSGDGFDVSALEAELRDLREKYFQMSLKYAEVEAQREELVLKLKNTNNKRRWF